MMAPPRAALLLLLLALAVALALAALCLDQQSAIGVGGRQLGAMPHKVHDHPLCNIRLLWHACHRPGGIHVRSRAIPTAAFHRRCTHVGLRRSLAVQGFEHLMWLQWAVILGFWLTTFILVVHCGATKGGPRRSRCIMDAYCPCCSAERIRRAREQRDYPGIALHELSVQALQTKALAEGISEETLQTAGRRWKGSGPKEPIVRLLLGWRLPERSDKSPAAAAAAPGAACRSKRSEAQERWEAEAAHTRLRWKEEADDRGGARAGGGDVESAERAPLLGPVIPPDDY